VKRNWLLYLVIVSLALNFGTIGSFAYLRYRDQAQRVAQEVPPPLPMRDLWRTLKLDETQRQTLHRLLPEHRAKVVEFRRELFNKRQELFALLKTELPSQAAIHTKIGEISTLQGKLEEELVLHLLEVRKQLKPEQRTAFLEIVQTRLDKALDAVCGPMGGRRGHWRGPGVGPGPGMPPPGMGPGAGPPPGPGRPGCPD
jgi:Spy/CpxP family protein refolding chaperone